LTYRMVVWLFLGAFAACQREHTISLAERAKAAQVVSGRLDEWALNFSNRNLDSLGALYDHGRDLSVAWHDGRRTTGWIEEVAAQRAFIAGVEHLNVTVRDASVDVVAQDVAVAIFSFAVDVVVDGRRSVCAGPGTSVWVRESGDNWKIRTLQTACANSL